MPFSLAATPITSRLILATGKYASDAIFSEVRRRSGSRLVVIGARDFDGATPGSGDATDGAMRLPSTTGARNAREAVAVAERGRDLFSTNWVRVHIQGDASLLLPDPIETLAATADLVDRGFVVFPMIQADPILADALQGRGASALFVLGSPMGSLGGLESPAMLERLLVRCRVPVILAGGIASPSQAAGAMELGVSAVCVHTAIALSTQAPRMAEAFRQAIEAGRAHYESGREGASGLTSFLDP